MPEPDIVTVAEAKAQLNMTDSVSDAELGLYVSAATGVVERWTGALLPRTVTDVFDGGRPVVMLSALPVRSITSVTDSGDVVPADGYRVSLPSGVLTRVAGPSPMPFLPGVGTVTVEYVAGQAATAAELPGRVRLAALIILQHMWETQRPAAAGPFSQASDDFDPRYAYSIPRRAQELLGVELGEAVGFA